MNSICSSDVNSSRRGSRSSNDRSSNYSYSYSYSNDVEKSAESSYSSTSRTTDRGGKISVDRPHVHETSADKVPCFTKQSANEVCASESICATANRAKAQHNGVKSLSQSVSTTSGKHHSDSYSYISGSDSSSSIATDRPTTSSEQITRASIAKNRGIVSAEKVKELPIAPVGTTDAKRDDFSRVKSIKSTLASRLATSSETAVSVTSDSGSDSNNESSSMYSSSYSSGYSSSASTQSCSTSRRDAKKQVSFRAQPTGETVSTVANGGVKGLTVHNPAINKSIVSSGISRRPSLSRQTRGDYVRAGSHTEMRTSGNSRSSSSSSYSTDYSTSSNTSQSYSSSTYSEITESRVRASRAGDTRDDVARRSHSRRTSTALPKHSAHDHTAVPSEHSTYSSSSSESSSYYIHSTSTLSKSRSTTADESYSSYDYSSEGITGSYSESDGDLSTTHACEPSKREKEINSTQSLSLYPSQQRTSNMSHTYSTSATIAHEMVIIDVAAHEIPVAPAMPRRCFVAASSLGNNMYRFFADVLAIQKQYEAQRLGNHSGTLFTAVEYQPPRVHRTRRLGNAGAFTASAAVVNEENEVRRGCVTFTPTPDGFCSARTTRLALGVLKLTSIERKEVLAQLAVPVAIQELRHVFTRYATVRIKNAVAQQLLCADPFRHGELSLRRVAEKLNELGIATSVGVAGVRIGVNVPPQSRTDVLCMTMEQDVYEVTKNDPTYHAVDDRVSHIANAHAAAASDNNATNSTAASVSTKRTRFIDVCRIAHTHASPRAETVDDTESIMAAMATMPRLIRWRDSVIYLGSDALCAGVTSRETFARLRRDMETAMYICLLTQLYTVRGCTDGEVMVQYPHLIRGILLQVAPSTSAITTSATRDRRTAQALPSSNTQRANDTSAPNHTSAVAAGHAIGPYVSICVLNLFRTLYHPAAYLAAYRSRKNLLSCDENSSGDAGTVVESTLQLTADSIVKRCRNVIPLTTQDGTTFLPPHTIGTDTNFSFDDTQSKNRISLNFALRSVKLYTTASAPVRCYCLVSSVTVEGVYLPAVMVPVKHTSTLGQRDKTMMSSPSGPMRTMSWTFGAASSRDDADVLHFNGPATDKLYCEFCYETEEMCYGEDNSTNNTAEIVVWCAGYVSAVSGELQTGKLVVHQGSLLNEPVEDVRSSMVADNKTALHSKGGFLNLFKRNKRVVKHPTDERCTTAMKLKVFHPQKTAAREEASMDLPDRYLVMRRHRRLTSQLRETIRHTGNQCAYQTQALRQYSMRQLFLVTSNVTLMDQLLALWKSGFARPTSRSKETTQSKAIRMLRCVTQLAALHNFAGKDVDLLANYIIKQKRLSTNVNDMAARQPVCI